MVTGCRFRTSDGEIRYIRGYGEGSSLYLRDRSGRTDTVSHISPTTQCTTRKLEQVQPFIQVLRRELRRALIQCLVSKSHATVDVDFIIKEWTQYEWTQLAQEVLRDSESSSSSSSVTNSESLGCLGFQVDSWCHDIIFFLFKFNGSFIYVSLKKVTIAIL